MEDKPKSSLLEKIAEHESWRKIIIIAGLLGIALIFLSGYLTSGGTSTQQTAVSSQPQPTAQSYEGTLETELQQLVTGIQGVGNARVFVTLEQTAQTVYATEEKTSGQTTQDKSDGTTTRNESDSDNETSYILVKNADGSEKALQVTEIQPVVKGVVVVCDGGDSPQVQQNIIDAVTTALHITSVRVCVIKAK
jgi:stage III sporulation protein AG